LQHSPLKTQLLLRCQQYVESRIATARRCMDDAQEAANDEQRSSAGDKYETSRAMMQIERDKAAAQLSEALRLRNTFSQILPENNSQKIVLGSLVTTKTKKIFICIGIGKLNLEGEDILVVAPTSPLGAVLMGLAINDKFNFNGELIQILNIE
jgi:transcription elongation GreA/GreB family factor